MIAPALALFLIAQPPAPVPPPARPIAAAAISPLPVNSTAEIIPPAFVFADLTTLHGLYALAKLDTQSDEAKRETWKKANAKGLVGSVDEPTRLVIHEVIRSELFNDDGAGGRPLLIYSGKLLDGPAMGRQVLVLGRDIADGPAASEIQPPTAAEVEAARAAERAAAERIARIYRAAKTGRTVAAARAASADASIRRQVQGRETAAWRRRVMKEFALTSEGELDAIIRDGQAKDGTADRIAAKNTAGKARAQASNDAQLMAIGAMIDRAGAQVLAADAAARARAASDAAWYARTHPNLPVPLPLMGGVVVPGHPWSSWAPTFSASTSKTR